MSPISRRFFKLKMQHAGSSAVADALRHAIMLPNAKGQARLEVQARRMANCAASTVLKLETPKGDATQIIRRNRRSCKGALCYPCARNRAYVANKKIGTWLDAIISSDPATRFAFLTLTSRNMPLDAVGDMLTRHEKALTRFWRGKQIARAVTGHVTGIEIALRKGKDGEWQAGVHSHSLMALHTDYFNKDAKLYLTQRALVNLWKDALRVDYTPIAYVTAIAANANIRASVRECVKYAVAPHKLFERDDKGIRADPVVVMHLSHALYKRRLVRYGGIFTEAQRALRNDGDAR